MRQNEYETPFYIRTAHGETFFVDTLEEVLETFLDDEDGYRITLKTGNYELVIRRGEFANGELGDEAGANVTRRILTPFKLEAVK